MSEIKNLEIEYKYRPRLSLTDFHNYCKSINPQKFVLVSGWDYFYSKKSDPDSFYRHRVNANDNQFTFKRKHEQTNSTVRTEHNIDLPLTVSTEKVRDLAAIHGYIPDCSIFKNCFIYNYETYTLVYYIVYDNDMVELGRFVEVEMREDYAWTSKEEALAALDKLDFLLAMSGIVGEKFSESLFEMYRVKEIDYENISSNVSDSSVSNPTMAFELWVQKYEERSLF